MHFNLFYTMVQKSQKWPKTQIKGGGGSCLNACLKKANPRTELYTSGSRTPSVDLRFRSFFHQACRVFEVFVDRLFFFQVFFCESVETEWHKSVVRNDAKSVTSKLEHVYLLFDCRWSPTACQSLTFLQDSSALSMLTKNYKL